MIIGTGQPLLRELEGCLNMDPRFWSLRNLKRLSVPEKHTSPGFKLRLMLFFFEWTNEATLCIDISLMPNVSRGTRIHLQVDTCGLRTRGTLVTQGFDSGEHLDLIIFTALPRFSWALPSHSHIILFRIGTFSLALCHQIWVLR